MRAWLLIFLCFCCPSHLWGAGVEVGQFDNPRDLTLKIHDPYAQENMDLMQPVVGQYKIKVLPSYLSESGAGEAFDCRGLYFKQVGKLIYIDIRRPPVQNKAGAYDLSVSLSVPGEADSSNRLKRHIVYTDSATDVLLVIDNSRSMKKNDPHGLRFQACENFVHLASLSDTIQKIGIVKFSGAAKVVLPWTRPSLGKERHVSRLLSQSRPGNFTNINDAFELCADLFEDSVAAEKVVVLLTDGKNEPDIYRDTHKQLKELGVRVFTVGLSRQADTDQLRLISKDTGGEFFQAVDDAKLMRIYNKIAQQLSEFKSMMEGSTTSSFQMPISSYDQFVDINVFSYPPGTDFELLNEQGQVINSSAVMGDGKDSTKLLRLSKPQPGLYRLRAKSDEEIAFSYDVNTHSRLFMKVFPLESKYLKGEVAHFAISLAMQETPMLGAEVKVKIMRDDGTLFKELTLFDDGVHGDNHANDGVYCALCPLDLEEGRYLVEIEARGKTQSNEPFLRLQKDQFEVLEASAANKDYFLASILPLYLDLGSVEQGHFAKASLRLSFEGREARKVELMPGSDVKMVNGSSLLSWDDFEFPESIQLEPSMAKVFTLSLKVPLEAAVGKYSGEMLVRLGDQEVLVPIDVDVKKGALSRMAPLMSEPEIPKPRMMDLDQYQLGESDLKAPDMIGDFQPQKNGSASSSSVFPMTSVGSMELAPKEKEPVPVVDEEPEVEVLPPIQFKVSPQNIPPFVIAEGQFASCLFLVENLSSFAGNVLVELDGVGDLGRSLLVLEPGEKTEVVWNWEARESDVAPRDIKLRFHNAGSEIKRSLAWALPPILKPWFFYVTVALLSVIALIYGFLFILAGERPHGFISLSAVGHLILVIWAFYTLLPPPLPVEKEVEVDDMVFEILPVETVSPERVKEMMTAEEEKLSLRSPEQPKEMVEAKPMPMEKMPLESKRDVLRPSPSSQVKERDLSLQSSEREIQNVEREFKGPSMVVDTKPTVLSVNDRPARRAILRKRTPQQMEADRLSPSRTEDKLVRERRLERLTDPLTPQKVDLKTLDRPLEAPSMLGKKNLEVAKPELLAEPQELKVNDELKSLTTEAPTQQDVEAKDLTEAKDLSVAESERLTPVLNREVVAMGNVSLPSSQSVVSQPAMVAKPIKIKEVSVPLKVQKVISESEEVAAVSLRTATESEVVDREIEMDYAESRLQRSEKQDVDLKVIGSSAPVPAAVSLPQSEFPERLSPMGGRINAPTAPNLKQEMASQFKAQPMVVQEASMEGQLRLGEKQVIEEVEGTEVELGKATEKGFVGEKEKSDMSAQRLAPVELERKELLGDRQRPTVIRESIVGKRNRSLPSSSLHLKRLSPTKLEPEKDKP